MAVTQMHQFPIEHGGQPVGIDHDIAHAEIAMDQHGLNGSGNLVFEPAERHREDGAIPAIADEARFEVSQHAGRGHFVEFRQRGVVNFVNSPQFARQITQQRGRRRRQDFGRVHLCHHAPHDIAGANVIARLDLADDFRRFHPGFKCSAHHGGFDRVLVGPPCHELQRRRAAEDIGVPRIAEGRAFHVRPARQAGQIFDVGVNAGCAGHDPRQCGLYLSHIKIVCYAIGRACQ
jgi:hypothetical protein